MRTIAYHSTTPAKAQAIVKSGFRIPKKLAHSSTDSRVGTFYPAIFFARSASNAQYGSALITVILSGSFKKLPKGGVKLSLAENLAKTIAVARKQGFDGVDTGWDTSGIAVINPAVITIRSVVLR